MFLVTLILIIIVCLIFTSSQFSIKFENETELISCAMDIVNEYVTRRTVVFYTEEENNSSLWLKMIRSMRKPFMIVSQKIHIRETDKLLVILFPLPGTKYTAILKKLRNDTLYIIVGTNLFQKDNVTEILTQFHEMKMVYNVFLFPLHDRINIYTSFPYSDNHCAVTGTPKVIDIYADGNFNKNANLFYTGKYWNMHGCTLTCLGNRLPPDAMLALDTKGEIVFEGITKELLDILSEKLNFKPKIVLLKSDNSSLDRSWFFYNDTVDQITESLRNEQVDFAIGLFSQLAFFNDSAITFGKETRFECYTWAVPIRAGKKRYIVMNYVNEFSSGFWLLFIFCFILAVFVISGISTVLGENTSLQSPFFAFYYIFSTILNQPVSVRPKPWSLRIFLAHWLVFVLVITTAYQASLWSFMTIPYQVNNIHTLQDLLDAPLEISGAQQMLNILQAIESNKEEVKKMINRFSVLPPSDFNDIIRKIETKRNFAVFGEKRHLRFYSKNINKIFDTDRVFFVDGCLMQSLSTPLLFPPGSPLYDPINSMLIRLLQHGLMQKIGTLYGLTETKEDSSYRQSAIPQQIGTMSLYQFKGIFLILMLGYGTSFVVFVCEIIVANMSDNKRQVKVIIGPKLYYRKSR